LGPSSLMFLQFRAQCLISEGILASPIKDQIRHNVQKFVNCELLLDELLQWFVPISSDIEKSNDPSLIALVHEIDGILAEGSSAKWPEADI
jgi:hypothetical protein